MLLRSLRSLQVLLSAPKLTKTNRNYSVRFFISLVCNRTCDNARHCLHTSCAPARCTADASLPRINLPVPLLRSFYSLQVLLSAPSVMIYKKRLIDHHTCVRSPKSQNLFLSKRFINSYFGFFNTEQVFYFRCYYLYKILTTLIKNYFVFLFFRIVPNPTTW